MTPAGARPPRRAWLATLLITGCIVIAAVAIGMYARPSRPMMPPGAGRSLPRVPPPPPDLPALLHELGVGSFIWYAVALAFPLLLWGSRRLGAERPARGRAILTVVAVVVGLTAVSIGGQYFAVYGGTSNRPPLLAFVPSALAAHLLAWTALAGVVAAIEWRRRAMQAALERERLRAQVAEQRLIALTGQLQPHFLFNTLQGISTLIHRDGDAADDMLAKLSDLLRELLRTRESAMVSLGDELRYTRTYLDIAKVRFGDRLTFDIDVPPDVEDAAVPLFILQPLVENALSHGIGGRMSGGRVIVRARRLGARLSIEVLDDGAGLSSNGTGAERLGIGNTRERLRASFGSDQRLVIEPAEGGGTAARIEVPYRTAATAAMAV